MVEIGYTLACEEHRPNDLVRFARCAEEVGFRFAMISDHYHPWIDRQGNAPFAWTVIGALAQATERIPIGTGVTCPLIRYHPGIIAQAAATAAAMLPGRFILGLGSGENLNEHVFGDEWPPVSIRLEMLEEAVEVIRELWTGEWIEYYGLYYTITNARLYTLPDEPPPIYLAASGPRSAELAGQIGDGFVSTSPQQSLVQTFEQAGGAGKPRYGQVTVCYAESEAQARRIAYEHWPTSALKGQLGQELALPQYFQQAVATLREEDVATVVTCGPDPERHVAAIQKFVDAGYDHVFVHQVGPDQEGFFTFYEREVLPRFH